VTVPGNTVEGANTYNPPDGIAGSIAVSASSATYVVRNIHIGKEHDHGWRWALHRRGWQRRQLVVRRQLKSQVGKLAGASQQHLAELLASAQSGKPASPAARTEHTALDVFHTVLAHGSSHGFLIATIFGIVAVGAALVLINVRKSDVGQATERAVVVA
jgi:hypothetical protein